MNEIMEAPLEIKHVPKAPPFFLNNNGRIGVMGDFFQFSITGLTIGSIYAIVGLGFVLIYSVTKVINLAQGEFVMLGGMIMFSGVSAGLPYWVSFIITILIVMILGWIMERLMISRAKGADAIGLIILTIGAAIFIRGISSMIWRKTK